MGRSTHTDAHFLHLSHGFINYYGRQRFGTGAGAGRTHAVGAAIARGDLADAARLVLAPRGGVDDAAREAWLAGSAGAAATAKALHRGAVAERALLTALARQPGDYAAAFGRVPHGLRSMYTHALQSWLWNVGASARAEVVAAAATDRAAVVEGDVLLASDAEDDGGSSDGDDRDDAPRRVARVRLATAADAASTSPSRVVLPLIAPGMLHPAHAATAAVTAAAAGVGVDAASGGPADARARPPPKTVGGPMHAAGGYRRLLVVPSNVSLRFVAVGGEDDDVLTEGGALAPGVEEWRIGQPLPESRPHLAAVLTFDLPKSAYATMALREVMRRPSAGSEMRKEGEK